MQCKSELWSLDAKEEPQKMKLNVNSRILCILGVGTWWRLLNGNLSSVFIVSFYFLWEINETAIKIFMHIQLKSSMKQSCSEIELVACGYINICSSLLLLISYYGFFGKYCVICFQNLAFYAVYLWLPYILASL